MYRCSKRFILVIIMPINWQIKVLSKTNSTQDIVMLAAQEGDAEGYTVQAMTQTSARGRHGNQWDAPMGNIYISFLLRPNCDLSRAGELGFVIAVGLSNTIDIYLDKEKHTKTLKWPNDILIDGLKISGILLESNLKNGHLDGIVVGIGLNIFNAPEFGTCVNNVAKEPVYVNKVRDAMLKEIAKTYDIWQAEGFTPIRNKWLENAHGLGQGITARLPKESFKGIFGGLTEDGSLILKQDNGEDKIITAGNVHFGEVYN